ncbi:YncE family protein [Nocardia takedensis]|uniref:YncE family protein n=1 Tax=Nocardia takedensis TaxID=259390 RepID=UPI003F7674A0
MASSVPMVDAPTEVVVDSREKTLYVSEGNTKSIVMVDITRNDIVATIPVGGTPGRMVIDPKSGTLYATTNGPGKPVVAIDTRTRQIVARISMTTDPIGHSPNAMAVDSEAGFLYVATEFSNSFVAKVDIATNAVIAKTSIPGGAYDIDIDPDIGVLYLSLYDNVLLAMDSFTNEILRTIPIGAEARGLAIDSQKDRLYLAHSSKWLAPGASRAAYNLSVLDTITYELITTIEVEKPPYDVAVDPSASAAYFATAGSFNTGEGGTVVVVDATSNAIADLLPFDSTAQPVSLACDSITHAIYVAMTDRDALAVFK